MEDNIKKAFEGVRKATHACVLETFTFNKRFAKMYKETNLKNETKK
jgi:hypothetical protein